VAAVFLDFPKSFHANNGILAILRKVTPAFMCNISGRFRILSQPVVFDPIDMTNDVLIGAIPLCYLTFNKVVWGPGSSVGIATGYGLDSPGSNPGMGEIFRARPDRPRVPPSLLYNGYRVFPGGKAAGAWG
jgi:hypothetical protein